MQRAKCYMLKLANGINPIDDSEIAKDSALQNERLSKCFLYLAEVLDGQVNLKVRSPKPFQKQFAITPEEIASLSPLARDCTVSELAGEINRIAKEKNCKKLAAKTINDWLVKEGYLKNREVGGKTKRELTADSANIGITSKQGMGAFGAYTIVMYTEQAQQYIIDHLEEIAEFAKEDKNVSSD